MAADKTKILTAEQERQLRQPIDAYVGGIQEKIDALRANGTSRVVELQSSLDDLKRDRIYTQEEKAGRRAALTAELEKAKAVEAQNKAQISQLISQAEAYLKEHYDKDYYQAVEASAKVEAAAYLPLLDQLRQTGLTCILVEMPFHLAIFDVNAAEDVMSQFPDIRHWYIAGHSMGGAMASQFASEHPDEVDGLILLGAYLYGDYPPADTLTVYGSLNQSVEDKIDYTENVVEIEGGNHAQFGNYGPQEGDLPATISAEEQQAQTVEAISDFIAQQQE